MSSTHDVPHIEFDISADQIEEEHRAYRSRHLMAALRIMMGATFLWAFIDKAFGLGFATAGGDAWVRGGSPTTGFLTGGTEGKMLHEVFTDLAGPVADWLFMVGLLGIGLALLLGVGMRLAAAAGATLLGLMWLASLPLENNPVVDDHLVSAVLLVALARFGADRTLGLGRRWSELALVKRLPILR